MYLLLFANYILGGPEVLDLQFRNAQKESYTLCLREKGPPWNTLELCHILTDFQNFALLESVLNLLQNACSITHLTLGMLPHHLGKLRIQIFFAYSTDMEENVNKLHFECTDINSCRCVTVYPECVHVLTNNLKYLSVRMHS